MNNTKFWLLSAGKNGELWPAFWTQNRIAIGWSDVGDLRSIQSNVHLKSKIERLWPGQTAQAYANQAGQIWRFYREIRIGDVVFIRSFLALIGIALVDGDYDFIEEDDPLRQKLYSSHFEDYFPHTRPVRWISLGGGMKQPLTFTKLTVLKNLN